LDKNKLETKLKINLSTNLKQKLNFQLHCYCFPHSRPSPMLTYKYSHSNFYNMVNCLFNCCSICIT